jgi:hypothetical protein
VKLIFAEAKAAAERAQLLQRSKTARRNELANALVGLKSFTYA